MIIALSRQTEMKERVTAAVNLTTIRRNYKHIKTLAGSECRVMAVVKADAYGHGAARVGSELYEEGCRDFAVACLSEAQAILNYVRGANILILGPTDVAHAGEIIESGFIQAADSYEYCAELAKHGRIKVHVKVDTGMSRIGIYCHHERDVKVAADEIERISKLENIDIRGIFTHFADSDGSSDEFTKQQFAMFKMLLDELEKRGINVGTRHCCNSAATLRYPEMRLDMVRAGIILYGLMPSDEVSDPEIRPAMKLSARISAIHKLEKGDCVSYGCAYTADRDTRIAVISIGYADGFSRVYSGRPLITVNGRTFATVGRICMDMCMIDIGSDFDCRVGDEAVIFETAKQIDEMAKVVGTINYEIICSLRQRVLIEYIK